MKPNNIIHSITTDPEILTYEFLCKFFLFKISGKDWNAAGVRGCSNKTMPVKGSVYPGEVPAALKVVKEVISKITKPVHLLDITTLSQLRKDPHPASYNGLGGMDCNHWCIAGLPDTWNLLLYTLLTI